MLQAVNIQDTDDLGHLGGEFAGERKGDDPCEIGGNLLFCFLWHPEEIKGALHGGICALVNQDVTPTLDRIPLRDVLLREPVRVGADQMSFPLHEYLPSRPVVWS